MASVLFTNLDFPEELYASSSTTTTSSSSSAATERTVSLNPLVSALLDLAPSVYLPLEDQRKDEEGNSKSSGKIHNSSSSWSSSSTAAAFIRDFVFWKQVSQVTENVRVQQQEKVAGQQMRQKPAAATTTALPADRRSSSPTAHIDQDIDAVIVSAHRQVSSSSSPTISLDSKVQQAKSANDKDPQKSDLKQQSPEKDKDIEPLSAATVAIVTVGSALGLFSTFKASQSYANHVFLDEFHIHLIHLHRVLAATEHWCKERSRLGLPVPAIVFKDVARLKRLVDLLERLDSRSHESQMSMAYMAAAGSSFVAIISAIMMRSSSTVPQSLFRLGTLGIAASAAYGVYLTGIRSSSYWKRSVWLLVAECKQIVDALRQDHNTSSPISYSIFWEGDQDQKKTETESNSIKLQN